MIGGGRRIPGMPKTCRKDRDEDLLLFKELHKREKDRIATLLQPISDEFEPNSGGNHALYRISSGKKGSGYEFFGENGKNDYDWLKTPPATPLFPSLEMEANNASELVHQREIPILQPLSRFSENLEARKATNGAPVSKPKIPARSVTPNQRQSLTLLEAMNTKAAPIFPNQKKASFNNDSNKPTNVSKTTTNPTNQREKESQKNFVASNLSKNIAPESKARPLPSRGVSPSVRSTIPAQIPGFSNETPPNLKTDRSTSATRGRPVHIGAATTLSVNQKPEPVTNPRRQSCSPSVTRGRKESDRQGNLATPRGKILTGNGTQIFGSKMVDKVMNARKLGAEAKPKPEAAVTTAATTTTGGTTNIGYGRMMSKSPLDMAFVKQMEMKRDRARSRPRGFVRGTSVTRE